MQTILYETVRALATWTAPFLCFTAQDVADELGRVTGEPFDVHGQVRDEVSLPGHDMKQMNLRWTEEIRPQREAILKQLEPFRAAGHKSLEARIVVRPSADELPDWTFNRELLAEVCVVSGDRRRGSVADRGHRDHGRGFAPRRVPALLAAARSIGNHPSPRPVHPVRGGGGDAAAAGATASAATARVPASPPRSPARSTAVSP